MPWLREKVLNPILNQLKQGATPQKLAWSVSLGAAFALFPILGSTTFLCGAVGAVLRLNHVAMQTVNYLLYAPHLVMIPVFIRIGEKITGATPIAIDLEIMTRQFTESPSQFLQDFGMAGVHGIIAWALILPIPTWVATQILARSFSRLAAHPPQSGANKV
jgi:uncharacterized protein (DUF2062 family)